ncbi:MAG: hypothetical protein K8L91_08485 [Anaerolineae bacterium]|nr:hypothetical protein [Anaerolineae bacterium]
MNPEDAVLVGVVSRKRDFEIARDQHWYRVPTKQAPNGITARYIALFFSSAKTFGEQASTIAYYAEIAGYELTHRRDLLPDESPHARDDEEYYKLQFRELIERTPPIVNKPKPHRFAFIYTTWDRFEQAHHIRDLYSTSDYFVDRVFHALKQGGINPLRSWEAARSTERSSKKTDKPEIEYPIGARIRVLCENGNVTASTNPADKREGEEFVYLQPHDYLSDDDAKESAHQIMEHIERLGGAKMIDIPVELY